MKLSLYSLTFILLLGLAPVAMAQTSLTVIDDESGEAIPSVVITMDNGDRYLTDDNGQVSLELSAHTKALFTHIAYEATRKTIAPNTPTDIRLTKKANQLSEVVISSFESERYLMEQAAAVSKIDQEALYRFNETSIVNAFNTKSGIRFEERAPGSYRVSIRGSSLRAPFGVRNVKIYWDGIPFTAPDGTTALNILDLSNIEGAEIIKGPAGSIYGAGNGGVISFTPGKINQNKAETSVSGGSYGLLKYRVAVDQMIENGSLSASYVKQQSDGYRDHSALDRGVFQLQGRFEPSDKQRITTQLLYSDLFYEIPGGLTEEQMNANPRQARPGSAEQNASINQESLYGTLVHDYRFNKKWSNHTAVYLQTTDFENPFNLDYKRETQYGYGARTKFQLNDRWGKFPVRLLFGGEYQFANTSAQNFGNREGRADTIRFADDLITTQGFLFQQIEINWTNDLLMTLGLSENFSRYDINRTVDASAGDPYAAERNFDPVIVPRIGLSAQLTDYSSVYGSISSGFSPPTIDEVRTNEGSINLDLEAEKGTNYEVGYRAEFLNGNVQLDASAFFFKLDETITTYTNPQGVVLFRNAGATDQKGLEAQLDYILLSNPAGWIQQLKMGHAYSFHHFRFKDYINDGEDFSGNALTGVPQNNLVNRLDLTSRTGLYLNLTYQWVDEIPLTDDNAIYQDPYHLMNARLGWRKNFGSTWQMEIYGGTDNLLDQRYSLGNDLNAFGGRYYQPAADRNFYGGVKVKMLY
ncbi:TonB-dependent receptor [Echinicola strongylocentroti]|uniref:TonB-dependent receptor n=1 Tax=Echinicola strongylocentroti TaxID=1795355 RepID=A0A2Z4IIJ5_9BACT|nr:TonB-dependent receptor [Echinicola strongylocentroti]AWW30952.1 TonB-dependent receptor [Echinicola strongylocentroti]